MGLNAVAKPSLKLTWNCGAPLPEGSVASEAFCEAHCCSVAAAGTENCCPATAKPTASVAAKLFRGRLEVTLNEIWVGGPPAAGIPRPKASTRILVILIVRTVANWPGGSIGTPAKKMEPLPADCP